MAKIRYFKSGEDPNIPAVEFHAQKMDEPADEESNNPWLLPTAMATLVKGRYENPGHDAPDDITRNYGADPGEQLRLFDVHPSRIENAFSDYRMRAHTPTVLGMAINEAKNLGFGLTYSYDLSRHSAKLAKRGLELGVVMPNRLNPDASARNSLGGSNLNDYVNTSTDRTLYDEKDADPDEVKAGRETFRNIVRQGLNARKSHMSGQFDDRQMKLPGFD
jgi:hypothetical protein